mmetsp:Transcript_16354/g.39215  ORF Transcript_16354/g.39215 Transcript_16354/m.39215 type:complete len:766 (-) Transcript_16354:11-2308(-)
MMSPVMWHWLMRPDSSIGTLLNWRSSSFSLMLGGFFASPVSAPKSATAPFLRMLFPLRLSLVSVLFCWIILASASAPSSLMRLPLRLRDSSVVFLSRARASAVAPRFPINPGSVKQSSLSSLHHVLFSSAFAICSASESVHCISNATLLDCILRSVRLNGCSSHILGTRLKPKSTKVEGSRTASSSPIVLRGRDCWSSRIAHSRRRALPAIMRRETAKFMTLSHWICCSVSSALRCSVRITFSCSGKKSTRISNSFSPSLTWSMRSKGSRPILAFFPRRSPSLFFLCRCSSSSSSGLLCPTRSESWILPEASSEPSLWMTYHLCWRCLRVCAFCDALITSCIGTLTLPISSGFDHLSWSNTVTVSQPSMSLTSILNVSSHTGFRSPCRTSVTSFSHRPWTFFGSHVLHFRGPTRHSAYGSDLPVAKSLASRFLAWWTVMKTRGLCAKSKSSNPSMYQERSHRPKALRRDSHPEPSKVGSPFSNAMSAFVISCSSSVSHLASFGCNILTRILLFPRHTYAKNFSSGSVKRCKGSQIWCPLTKNDTTVSPMWDPRSQNTPIWSPLLRRSRPAPSTTSSFLRGGRRSGALRLVLIFKLPALMISGGSASTSDFPPASITPHGGALPSSSLLNHPHMSETGKVSEHTPMRQHTVSHSTKWKAKKCLYVGEPQWFFSCIGKSPIALSQLLSAVLYTSRRHPCASAPSRTIVFPILSASWPLNPALNAILAAKSREKPRQLSHRPDIEISARLSPSSPQRASSNSPSLPEC